MQELTAADLVPHPSAPMIPLKNRKVWQTLRDSPSAAAILKKANELLTTPLPPLPDELYLEFSRNGNRSNWEAISLYDRRNRIRWLVIAECLEAQGRFLPAIEELFHAICAERCWTFPAHDRDLACFNGTRISIDLGSSMLACMLAFSDYLLGDALQKNTRARIRECIHTHVLTPFRDSFEGRQPLPWWATCTMNWNAVCLGASVATALTILEPPEERLLFARTGMEYIRNYLRSFTPDGYCSEGVGYWNYGFSFFVLLTETVRHATQGRVDLMTMPEVNEPARFPSRMEIAKQIYPAFSDCVITTRPDSWLMTYLAHRSSPTPPTCDYLSAVLHHHYFQTGLILTFLDHFPAPVTGKDYIQNPGIRSWFPNGGVLISRMPQGVKSSFAVAMKGGHNNEDHNHNDVGSYVVTVEDVPVLLDPGPEVYTGRTFSPQRYDSRLLNSYGHPVPRIAGTLQSTGAQFRATVLAMEPGETQDTFALDITAAYEIPALKKLVRTFCFSRNGHGSFSIQDSAEFLTPTPMEVPLITLGTCIQESPSTLKITSGASAVHVHINTHGVPFSIHEEVLDREESFTQAIVNRIAIRLPPALIPRLDLHIEPCRPGLL